MSARWHRTTMGATNFHKSNTRGHWKIFSATTAFPEGTSIPRQVEVKFFCDTGTVHIDDVEMWYRVSM